MTAPDFIDLDLNIARARVFLSLTALISIYVDPTAGGAFYVDTRTLVILLLHLAYSASSCFFLSRRRAPPRLPQTLAAFDILFAIAVGFRTEGPTSPAYVFFAFAIIAIGCREGFRAASTVTISSMLLYLSVILIVHRGARDLYFMRPAYLGIVGYLIGFLGQQRVNFEARIRALEAERQGIARSLHDDYVQALAGINLRLATCRELLSRGRSAETLGELTELQSGVAREFDAVRAYVRFLANVTDPESEVPKRSSETRFRVRAEFTARGLLVEQVLQIMLEGLRNTLQHGDARSAAVYVSQIRDAIRITIDDDGVGFPTPVTAPWSIASRVSESGGVLTIAEDDRRGAHLDIQLPVA
jgi:signal transduction histidine kinase